MRLSDITRMNVKRTMVVVCATGAVWMSAPGVSDTSGSSDVPVANPPAVETLADTSPAYGAWLHPLVTPRPHGRDLFSFVSEQRRPIPGVQAPTAPGVQGPGDAAGLAAVDGAALSAVKLSGIAEDVTPEGIVRTAIISGFGQLFLVKEGEDVTERYRVVGIRADGVEIVDTQGGTIVRIALR